MAAPKFDTTQTQSNEPGLSYTTPRAMPAKYDNMTGLLGLADKGIKLGVEIDKQQTIGEANELGLELSNTYENMSPTNINNLEREKSILEQQANEDPDNLEIMNQLTDITSKHNNAKAQEVVSPSEYKYRILKETQDLANANPTYADEIYARVSKTLGNRGINNLMKEDALLYKAQLDSVADVNKRKDDFLITLHYTPSRMTDEDRDLAYFTEKSRLRDIQIVEDMVQDGTIKNKKNIAYIQQLIDIKGGGIHKVASTQMTAFVDKLNNIADRLNNQEIDYKEARRLKKTEVIKARTQLSVIGSLEQTEENKAAYASFKQNIEEFEGDSDSELSGKTFFERKENVNKGIQAEQRFGRLLNGEDETSLRLSKLKIETYDFIINQAKLQFDPKEQEEMIRSILSLSVIDGKKFALENPAFASYNKNGDLVQKSITRLDPIFKEMIRSQKSGTLGKENNISPDMFGLYNNLYNTAAFYKNPTDRYDYDRKFINTIKNMDDEVFDYMLKNSETFLEDTKRENNIFLGALMNDAITNEVNPDSIQVSEAGIFSSSDSIASQRIARNLNLVADLEIKVSNNKRSIEHSEAVFNKFLGN
tara:strand:- start:293 stop:2068 length:1776 start_codon:yes stop_codon:yes gene_type:complete